jgi:hypothetical protein
MAGKWLKAATVTAAVSVLCIGGTRAAEETVEALSGKLWPRPRIEAALRAVEQQKKDGLLSDATYQRRKAALTARLAGTFQPGALSVKNPPLNFIQNGGFEQINRNSAPKGSRWLWWNGWSWGGNYVNSWEDRSGYVHSGKYSARIECKGEKGRIGIFTPALPGIPGVREYKLTFWAKGEGDNELFVNFEGDASGTLREKMPPEWKEFTLLGKPAGEKKSYTVFFYVTGGGTIWLDDVALVPVGGSLDE